MHQVQPFTQQQQHFQVLEPRSKPRRNSKKVLQEEVQDEVQEEVYKDSGAVQEEIQ